MWVVKVDIFRVPYKTVEVKELPFNIKRIIHLQCLHIRTKPIILKKGIDYRPQTKPYGSIIQSEMSDSVKCITNIQNCVMPFSFKASNFGGTRIFI